jgi:hypothetical protein
VVIDAADSSAAYLVSVACGLVAAAAAQALPHPSPIRQRSTGASEPLAP